MTFLTPSILFGLGLVGLPIIVHLIGRRRAPALDFSAYDFLAEVVERLARREQIRQLLLLLLRILIIALLALALAGPGMQKLAVATEQTDTLIVLDASRSMTYRLGNETLLDKAKDKVNAILAERSEGLALVVVAGAEATPLTVSPTADRSALRDAVKEVKPSDRASPLGAAVRRGLELFADRAVEVFVVSDLAQAAFTGSDVTLGTQVRGLQLVDAAERKAPLTALTNTALGPLTVDHLPDGAQRVTIAVHNFGGTLAKGELRLTVDAQVRARGFVEVAPGGTAEREFTVTDLAKGTHIGDVTLAAEGDGFSPDDTAPLVIEVFAEPRVLLVNGDPKSVAFRDEVFYLERALQAAQPPIAFDVTTSDDLPTAPLDQYGVLIMANVAAPTASVAQALTDFVQRGGGLFIALGDRVEFEAYNDALGAILPARLRDQWSVGDPKAPDAALHALGLSDINWAHPVFRRFEAGSEPAFAQSHTFRSFFVEAQDLQARARQLMRFTNGAPALLERVTSQGRVLCWLSTVDRDFSDLAIRPIFAPLMAQAVRYLGGSLRTAPDRALVARTPSDIVMPTGGDKLALGRVDGRRDMKPLPAGPVTFEAPGVYALFAQEKALPGTAFSVLETQEESDYTPVLPDELGKRWGVQDTVVLQGGKSGGGGGGDFVGYAHLFLLGLVLAFGVQSLLASRG